MSTRRRGNIGLGRFVLIGLAVALLIGMVVSAFAASTPDALQRAVIESACQGAADEEACMAEEEGAPLLGIQPAFMSGYEVGWLSGLLGVAVTFALGTGLVLLVRRSGTGTAGSSSDNPDRVS